MQKLNPVEIPIVSSSKLTENILVVESDIGKERIRFKNVYGLQETVSIWGKVDFLSIFDEVIQSAMDEGVYVCIQLDGNAKFGDIIIEGDPHEMTNNGKLLFDLIMRKNLVLVNAY